MTKEQEEAIEYIKESFKGTVTHKEKLEIILSMLEEKDKQIEELEKSVEQIYEDYQDIGKMAFDYSNRIELLDKVIDLMAKRLVGDVFSNDIELENIFNNKEDVKQYFENKVRQESDKDTTGK